ncbi:squalene synthase HpnC [Hydrogenophaga sp. NFH-34]|uniref:squalene synthase HpnC n=1 Tax=Hydrogenophaga sp. NFH-34 TaxID=2744446 RepID=UPI001F3AB710|nr:squalene synthase HpnC [Hydrogenophaga sp. NFH-34]
MSPAPTPPPASTDAGLAPLTRDVGHYENFPVASWLCPPALRPAVVALYHFARTADDLADEGNWSATERLAHLAAYRQALQTCLDGTPLPPGTEAAWQGVFEALARAQTQHRFPPHLLHDLLSAFEQDVRYTAASHAYTGMDELLAYCRWSAQPVGRLLLHLYGIDAPEALAQSDDICSALQLINFWQDISVDHPRGRHYLPADQLERHGLTLADFGAEASSERAVRQAALVAELCADARQRILRGAPLVHRIPGRAGWELRLVVQGGLRILDHLAAIGHRSWQHRVTLVKADLPRLLWRAWRMG